MGRVRNYIYRVTHVVGDVGRRIKPELKRLGLLCLLVVGVLLIAIATVQTPLKDLLPDFFDYLGVVVLVCIALLEWAEEKSWFRRTLFVLIVVSGGLSLGSVYVTKEAEKADRAELKSMGEQLNVTRKILTEQNDLLLGKLIDFGAQIKNQELLEELERTVNETSRLRELLKIPKATPTFEVGFIKDDQVPQLGAPVTEIVEAVVNGEVTLRISVLNTAQVTARTVVVIFAACVGCQYAAQDLAMSADALKPLTRSKAFRRLPPTTRLDLPEIKIVPPPLPSPGFLVSVGVSCDECNGMSEHQLRVTALR